MFRVLIVFALALIAATIAPARAQSSGGTYSVTHSVIAPATTSSGGAFAITATMGQPTLTTSSAGAFRLLSGYAAQPASNLIFSNGFEP
jgi:hypothetical protein